VVPTILFAPAKICKSILTILHTRARRGALSFYATEFDLVALTIHIVPNDFKRGNFGTLTIRLSEPILVDSIIIEDPFLVLWFYEKERARLSY
jgi:hypothetical protein